jgi:pimeloyl-ACP methyl ester carboxylesterase
VSVSHGTPESGEFGRATAPQEHVRVVAGERIRTIEQGPADAPVALLLHGLPGSAEDWNRLAPLLAARFRVIAIDRPGYGGTGGLSRSVPEQTELYTALVRDRTDRPSLVVGHSYGALPAAEMASRSPEVVGALGLLAPALRERRAAREVPPGTDQIRRLLAKPAVGAFVRATILSEAGRGVIAKIADPISFDPDPVDEEHLAGVRDRTLKWDALRSFLDEGQALADEAETVDAHLNAIVVPSVVVKARGDRVIRPGAVHRTAASIPHAELHEIDGGHMLTVSRAGEVAPLLIALGERAGLWRAA